jgi:small-conductance mechanosensitive channel
MKLLYRAWQANDVEAWLIATAIAVAVLIVLAVAKFIAVRVWSSIARRTEFPLSEILAQVARATKVWLLVPVALYGGASALELPAKLETVIDHLAVIAIMLQAAVWVNRFLQGWLAKRVEATREIDGESVTVLTLLGFFGRVAVWLLTLLLALDHLGFDITALVTGLGIGGIAIALAVQNILGDLFASLSIVLDKPFVVGDFVVSEGWRGNIERVGIKTTHIRSLDGEQIVISNAELLKLRIHNYKRMQERRILFGFGVIYQTPADKLERIPQLVRDVVEAQPKTRFDRAHFQKYGDSSLDFEVVYHVLDPAYNFYMDTQQAINLELYRRFAREGIDFAYPTRTLYVTNVGPPAAS